MSDIKRIVAVGTDQVAARGDFLMLKESTGPLLIDIAGQVIEMVQGDYWRVPSGFEGFKVDNKTGGAVTAIFTVTLGDFGRAAVVGAVVASLVKSGTVAALPDVPLGATAQTIVQAATPTRRSIIVKSLTANTAAIRVGDPSVAAARGHELQPGESITLDTNAAVWAYNASAAVQTVTVVEIQD